jgi:hypothetical protein
MPQNAHVKINGRPIEGASPFVAEIAVGSEAIVEAFLDGYKTRIESFPMNGDRMLDLFLDFDSDAGPPPTPDAAPPPAVPASTPEKIRRPRSNGTQPKPRTPDTGADGVMPI